MTKQIAINNAAAKNKVTKNKGAEFSSHLTSYKEGGDTGGPPAFNSIGNGVAYYEEGNGVYERFSPKSVSGEASYSIA